MIPQKAGTETDLNAKLDEDIKKAEEQQKEIKSKKPKLAQAVASKWAKYIIIGATAIGIGYKMFFAPTEEPVKKKKTNKIAKSSSANKEKEQKKMAEEKINRSKHGEIAKKEDSKNIISIGEQGLSNAEQLSKISVPKLELPETPPVPQINAIDVIQNQKEQQPQNTEFKPVDNTDKTTQQPEQEEYIEVEEEIIENGKKVKKTVKKPKQQKNDKNTNAKEENPTSTEPIKKKRKIKQKIRDKKGKIKTITTEVEMTDEEYAAFKENAKNKTRNDNTDNNERNSPTLSNSPLTKTATNQATTQTDDDKDNLPDAENKNKKNGKKNAKNQNSTGNLGENALEEMFLLAGNGPKEKTNRSSSGGSGKKDFILFDGASLAEKAITTTEASSSVQRMSNLENTIASGKIMEAVLETAINSEATGTIRAVMSKDVYGEAGHKILIPRGSRLYGSYTTTSSTVQTRLLLTWNKVIRPDGVVITMNADTYDQSGKKGIEGDIDTRYGELFKNSLLYSFVTLGTAIAVEKIAGIKNATSVNTATGTTVTNTSPANAAAQSVIDTAQDIAEKMTDGLTDDLNPVISIPQGTLLKIMSSTDIVISSAYKRRTQDVKID